MTYIESHDYLVAKFKRIGSLGAANFSTIIRRLEKNTIESGTECGRFIVVNVNGFIWRIHEESNYPTFFCLNREIEQKVQKKLTIRANKLKATDKRIGELYEFTEYPYKAGHMECIDRAVDSWAPTRKNANMIATQERKYDLLINEVKLLMKEHYITDQNLSDFAQLNGLFSLLYVLPEEFRC